MKQVKYILLTILFLIVSYQSSLASLIDATKQFWNNTNQETNKNSESFWDFLDFLILFYIGLEL